jgi:subtilase family protein
MKSDPIYQSDECPDYRRLLITYARTQPLDIFSIERELIDFVPKPYVEFTIADLHVKVWNLTNESLSVDNAIDRLKKDARFAGYGVERDMRLSFLLATTDPYSARQWALDRIEVKPAWDRVAQAGAGRPPVIIGVIDSGAQANHQDFDLPPRLGGARVVPPAGPNFADDISHGTMVAGTIAAVSNNNVGIAGVASNPAGRFPDLTILAMKFNDARNPPTALWAVLGMLQAIQGGAQIINVSWHVLDGSGLLRAMIATLGTLSPPVLVVAAAGNNGRNNTARPPTLPASYPLDNILSVMASNEYDEKPWFSNYGTNVDIAAPGNRIISTSMYYVVPPVPPRRIYNPAYRTYSGTSPAAAHASGAAALLLGIDDWTPLEIREHLIASADRVTHLKGLCRANGRLNLRRAVCGPFVIQSPAVNSYPRGSSLTVQWSLDYNSPVVHNVEVSIYHPASSTVVAPLGSATANAGALTANLPNQPRQNVVVRLKCVEKNLYTDSALFDIV